jgi:hypothetical protein
MSVYPMCGPPKDCVGCGLCTEEREGEEEDESNWILKGWEKS